MNTLEYDKLTIYEVESFHKNLLQWSNESNGDLILECGHLHKIDMAGIQLLLSAQKACAYKGVNLVLKNLSAEVASTIRIAGCEALLGGENE
jgi:anti-anti-sigma factor